MRLHTRFGVSVCLTLFLIVSLVLLLPSVRVSTQLQRIPFGEKIDKYRNGLWSGWGKTEDGDGVRLVVFGDSWVDASVVKGEGGRGSVWVDVLCEELNCTSQINFAVAQPSTEFPASPPTGAITSNYIYASAINESAVENIAAKMLPDLASQIKKYISRPPPSEPKPTIFVISVGFWDIYQFSSLNYAIAQNRTEASLNELFDQLNILYNHYAKEIANRQTVLDKDESANRTIIDASPIFRVVIPKLLDPTILPGWISQRPVPIHPSSVAEEQKNAVYLTTLWNRILENKKNDWIKEHPKSESEELWETYDPASPAALQLKKDIFYYDLPAYLVSIIREHQLEVEGLSDATGLGQGDSPFENVAASCMGAEDGLLEVGGRSVCKEPEEYLWWDGFMLGGVANDAVGKAVGNLVKAGSGMMHNRKDKTGWF